MGEHGHFSGIGAEMSMEPDTAKGNQPLQNTARFGNINQVIGKGTVGVSGHFHRESHDRKEPRRRAQHRSEHGQQESPEAFPQDIVRALLLLVVLFIRQGV